MSRLKNVGDRFFSNLKTTSGKSFQGQLGTIPDTSRVSNFLSTRRYLRVKPDTIVRTNDVVLANGVKFIVAEHGDSFHVDVLNKYFKLFQVDQELNWQRRETYKDPVTGIMKTDLVNETTKVYLSTQPRSPIEDRMHIPTPQIVAICNADVQLDDLIGGYIVTKVDHVLGTHLVELKQK